MRNVSAPIQNLRKNASQLTVLAAVEKAIGLGQLNWKEADEAYQFADGFYLRDKAEKERYRAMVEVRALEALKPHLDRLLT